jgi:nitrate reductase cytochrome c-type subunit
MPKDENKYRSVLDYCPLIPCRECGDLDYDINMQDNICLTCWEYGAEGEDDAVD